MEEIYAKARAKINLDLQILGKRQDNYHNIKSVFQKINLYDEIKIRKIDIDDFKLETNVEELNNEDNIIYKAYMKLKEKYKNITGIQITLNKRIPMQAGLAGGSTDCATFILCMNKLFDLKLSKNEIENIGKSLGADVVPCLYNKAVLAEGIGEIITKIDTNFKYYILIIKPKIYSSTKEMYKKLDMKKDLIQLNNTTNIINALKTKDLDLLSKNLYNVFEYVIDDVDIIENIKRDISDSGSIGTLMTGSGSCVYGIFKDKKRMKNAYEKLKNNYNEIYMCTSYNSKREEM